MLVIEIGSYVFSLAGIAFLAVMFRRHRRWRGWDADRRLGRKATLNIRAQTGWRS